MQHQLISHIYTMSRMNKFLVSPPKLENIGRHEPEGIGQLLKCHSQTAGIETTGNGCNQRENQQQEYPPPLQAPNDIIERADEGKEERKAQQQQTRDGNLLKHLIAKIPIPICYRFENISGKHCAIMPLGRKPTPTLAGEIIRILYLFIEHERLGQVMEVFTFIE